MLDGDMNGMQAIRMAHDMHSGDTERRILDSARRLFAEKGYEKTSIQDILNDLGLSKGGLYHHFKSDDSIPTAYPEEAAQLLSLLGNYWLMPCFYPTDHAGMEHRIRCLATMLDAIGVPVFDETLILRTTEGLTALTPEEDTASA